MEGWEDEIDVDDSDLHSVLHPRSLPSCSSSLEDLPRLLHPCSQLPRASQTLDCNHPPPSESQLPVSVEETNPIEEERNLPNLSALRPFIPGPAGTIQAAMRRQSSIAASKCSSLEEGVTDDRDLSEIQDDEEEGDFKLNPWLCALTFLGTDSFSSLSHSISSINHNCSDTNRIPQVVGIVKSCRTNGLGDLFITLKDPTGTIGATVHRKILSEGNAGRKISVGCVLILKQVVAFRPPRSQCYLNITLKNLEKLIPKSCGPPKKSILPPYMVMHGLEVKQLQTKFHVDNQSCNARKTFNVESRGKFIGEMIMDGRRPSLAESSSDKTVMSDARLNVSKRLISGASVAEWTDEQLEKLFSEYDDEFELVHPAT